MNEMALISVSYSPVASSINIICPILIGVCLLCIIQITVAFKNSSPLRPICLAHLLFLFPTIFAKKNLYSFVRYAGLYRRTSESKDCGGEKDTM